MDKEPKKDANETVEESTPLWVVPIPDTFKSNKHDAGTIHTWLASQGLTVVSVSVGQDEIRIDATEDPTSTMQNFDPPKGKKDVARDRLKNTDRKKLTSVNDLREAVIAIMDILEDESTDE